MFLLTHQKAWVTPYLHSLYASVQYKVAKPESALQPLWRSDPVQPGLLPVVAANLCAALSLEVEFTLQGFPTLLLSFELSSK